MKLLTEKEIKEMASNTYLHFVTNPTKATIADAWEEGYTQAQQDLLSQASENFNQWIYKYPDKCDLRDFEKPNHNYFVAEETWQACSIAHAKKMQERDAEIERLKKENEELRKDFKKIFYQQDELSLEEIEDIEVKWFFLKERRNE